MRTLSCPFRLAIIYTIGCGKVTLTQGSVSQDAGRASEDRYLVYPRRRRRRRITTKDKFYYLSRNAKHRSRFVVVLLRVFLTTTIPIPLIRTSLQY
jgi:hypothetical protein